MALVPHRCLLLPHPVFAASSCMLPSSCSLNVCSPSCETYSRPALKRFSARTVASKGSNNPNESTKEASQGEPESATRSRGLFNFVTDNPSSREAIQLPNAPAQDGNVGQMISQIENKGRDYGFYVEVGEFRWFVRETGSKISSKATIIFLHGAPTQSYSYRDVIAKMADAGYHCYAPDWLGFGFSEMPEPGDEFSYTEEAYHEEFDKLLSQLGIESQIFLIAQGFIVGSYGITWALKNPNRIARLGILNGPLTSSATLPPVFQQLRLPFIGEFTCQNAVLAERFIEKGSPYVLELDDADVYRLPYLDSSAPGFSLLAATRKFSMKDLMSQIENGFHEKSWIVPTIVLWGEADKYLPTSEAVKFVDNNRKVIKQVILDGAGHLPQEDWPEKVVEELKSFLR